MVARKTNTDRSFMLITIMSRNSTMRRVGEGRVKKVLVLVGHFKIRSPTKDERS